MMVQLFGWQERYGEDVVAQAIREEEESTRTQTSDRQQRQRE